MAEIKFYSDLSLMGGASIKNLRVENLATASIPVSGVDGQMVFDTDLNVLKFWDGTEWAAIRNDEDLQAAIDALESRMDAVEADVVAAQGTADQAVLDAAAAQATADLAETHAADAQTRVGSLEALNIGDRLDDVEGVAAGAVLDAAAAQATADLAETHAADAQTRVGVLEGQNLDSRLSAVEADDAGDDAAIAAAQAAADAAQGTADQAVLDAAAAQATADLAETHAADAQTRVGALEALNIGDRLDDVEGVAAQAILDAAAAQATADLAETHAADAQTRVGAIEAEDFPTRVVALENSALDHEGRLDAIETAPYASEGFVTGITDALDGRIDAIESAPYASEAYADQAAAGAVDAHNLDTGAHPMGIKWFTPTQLVNGPVTDTVASQSGVSLTTSGTTVASVSAVDPLGWLEFQGEITVSGTGSVTLDVEIDASVYGAVVMPQLTVNRGEATFFEYMIQAPATGVAQDYDLVFKTVAGTETADFGAIAIDAFGSDPFVVKSELDAVDARVTAIENAPYAVNADFTLTGDAVETQFDSPWYAGNVFPAVTVWEDATGAMVLVDVAREYNAGNDETRLNVTFNEAPADGATYTVAVKI